MFGSSNARKNNFFTETWFCSTALFLNLFIMQNQEEFSLAKIWNPETLQYVNDQVFFKQSFTNYQKVQSLAFDTLLRSDLCDDPQTREHVLDWQEASSRMSVSVHFQTMPDNVEDFKAYIEFNFNDDDED